MFMKKIWKIESVQMCSKSDSKPFFHYVFLLYNFLLTIIYKIYIFVL